MAVHLAAAAVVGPSADFGYFIQAQAGGRIYIVSEHLVKFGYS